MVVSEPSLSTSVDFQSQGTHWAMSRKVLIHREPTLKMSVSSFHKNQKEIKRVEAESQLNEK